MMLKLENLCDIAGIYVPKEVIEKIVSKTESYKLKKIYNKNLFYIIVNNDEEFEKFLEFEQAE